MTFYFRKLAMDMDGAYELVVARNPQKVVNAEFDDAIKPHVKFLKIQVYALNDLGDEQVLNISSGLHNLERLSLSAVWDVTDQGYDSFFGNVRNLRGIELGEWIFTDARMAIMAKHCRGLEDVMIHHHKSLTNRAIEAFVHFETPLVNLSIIHCDYIHCRAIEALVQQCKTLRSLCYTGTLSPLVIQAIADSSVCKLSTYKHNFMTNGSLVALPEESALQVEFLDGDD